MHSNEALEKFKFNPNYYLPDGKLKAKFLLPKLKDTIENAKNSRYIRQYSLDGEQVVDKTEEPGFDIVKYIFHDEEAPSIN